MKSEYHLFLCDTSCAHEPIVVFRSDTPFPAYLVGQRFDDHGWNRLRGVGVLASEDDPIRYTVHSVKSTIFVENGINQVQTFLNLEPFEGDRSPAFGETEPTMTNREALSGETTYQVRAGWDGRKS